MAKNKSENQEKPADGTVTITAKSPASQRECSVSRNLGATLAESVELFGESVIYAAALSQIEIRIQGAMRGVLDGGHKTKTDAKGEVITVGAEASVEDAIKAGAEYTPGVQKRSSGSKKDPIAVLAAKVKAGEMTEEEVLAAVRAQLAG